MTELWILSRASRESENQPCWVGSRGPVHRGRPSCQGPRAGADPFQEPTGSVWLAPKARELEAAGQAGGPTFQGHVCPDKGAMVKLGLGAEMNAGLNFRATYLGARWMLAWPGGHCTVSLGLRGDRSV